MPQVGNLARYIRRISGETTNDSEMPTPTVKPWLTIVAGDSSNGGAPTYTVGSADLFDAVSWGPASNGKMPFSIRVKRDGDMLWVRIQNMFAQFDSPDGRVLKSPNQSADWPEKLDYYTQHHVPVTLFRASTQKLFTANLVINELGFSFDQQQGILEGDCFGGTLNNRAALFAVPLNPSYSGAS